MTQKEKVTENASLLTGMSCFPTLQHARGDRSMHMKQSDFYPMSRHCFSDKMAYRATHGGVVNHLGSDGGNLANDLKQKH